jgi:7,8-dihydro-6-hydroxymethylpterin-pyrophosphokinase
MTIEELRKIAESATPAPYETVPWMCSGSIAYANADAKFINTFSPARILKMLEQLEVAKEVARKAVTLCARQIDPRKPFMKTGDILCAMDEINKALSRIEELEK